MSFLDSINEVRISGIVVSIKVKAIADGCCGALLKLKQSMSVDVDGEKIERESCIQIKVPPELYSTKFADIEQGDEVLISGVLVVDNVIINGREQPLGYMRVLATSINAHLPKPAKGFGCSTFKQN